MRKLVFYFLVLFSFSVLAQTQVRVEDVQEKLFNTEESTDFDKIEYQTDQNYSKERNLPNNLNEKYSGDDFNYQDLEQEVIKRQEPINSNGSTGFTLVGSSLPLIIFIGIAILIILAILQKSEFSSFRFKKYKTSEAEFIEESVDESIDQGDFESLIQKAVKNGDFRLATRYYYLWLLQNLSKKNYIEYHKDKTNSDYQFELKDERIRSLFSYVSYLYSYIWYGEFPVDQNRFLTIEKRYQSFMQQIK